MIPFLSPEMAAEYAESIGVVMTPITDYTHYECAGCGVKGRVIEGDDPPFCWCCDQVVIPKLIGLVLPQTQPGQTFAGFLEPAADSQDDEAVRFFGRVREQEGHESIAA